MYPSHRFSRNTYIPSEQIGGRTYSPCLGCKESVRQQTLPPEPWFGPGELGRIKSFYDDKGSNENVSFLIHERWNTAKASTQRLFPRGCLHTWCIFTDDSHGNVHWSFFSVQWQDMDLSSAQELHNNSAEISSFIRRWNHTWPSLAFKIRYFLFNALFQPSWTSKKNSPRWV